MQTVTAIACPRCNAPSDGTARFCTHCGSPFGAAAVAPATPHYASFQCQSCGGDGSRLAAEKVYCPTCRWLRPLGPGYDMPIDAFLWRRRANPRLGRLL
mgnify:FL=1